MEVEDLIQLSKREILDDSKNKALYINTYKAFFGTTPSCASCSFNMDFRKLRNKVLGIETETVKFVETKKIEKMKKYKLKKGYSSKIFSYPDENGRMNRRYGKDLDDDFVDKLFKIKNNPYKDFFEVLPVKEEKKKVETKKKEVKKAEPKKK